MANNCGLHCRYYTDKVLRWSLDNKMIVFLGALSFCLFVSTLAMSSQRNSARNELAELKASLITTTTLAPNAEITEPNDNTDATTDDTSGTNDDSTTPIDAVTTTSPEEETTANQEPAEKTTAPAVEDTTAPAVEDTTAPAVEDTTAPAVEDTTTPVVEDNVTTANDDPEAKENVDDRDDGEISSKIRDVIEAIEAQPSLADSILLEKIRQSWVEK